MADRPPCRVAVFRPDDERLSDAVDVLESLGADPVADAMLAVEPTGNLPRPADYVVFTSQTGVALVAGKRVAGTGETETTSDSDDGRLSAADGSERWEPGGATVVAIGAATADALREDGYPVDVVPAEFSSSGLVATLGDDVDGAHVELARSDHGSTVLVDGLRAAGATVTETVLYRLDRPADAGHSTEVAAAGQLDAALFTSSLTVEHFLDAAADLGVRDGAVAGLSEAVVGAIGEPTRETAEAAGISVDVVPDRADFEALARAAIDEVTSTRERE
jgi:uroporphyrinogen-III synthase